MINCRRCTWCLKLITDDFIITEEQEYLHLECYGQVNNILENETRRIKRPINPNAKKLISNMLIEIFENIKELNRVEKERRKNNKRD